MGSSASKASRAAGASARKYPTRTPPTSSPSSATRTAPSAAQQQQQRPDVRNRQSAAGPASAQATGTRNEAVDLDARDPDFAAALRRVGAVQPMPTYSPSSTAAASTSSAEAMPTAATGAPPGPQGRTPPPSANPAIAILAARGRIAREADEERGASGRAGFRGRKYVDVGTVRRALALRDERGMAEREVEKVLGLRKGVLAGLGSKGTVEVA